MKYIVTGKIAPYGPNSAIVGQEVFLSEASEGYFIWDGKHRAKVFDNWEQALNAAMHAPGPLWRIPSPESVKIVPVEE